MPVIAHAVYEKGHFHPMNLTRGERKILEEITPRQRRKFARLGIVPPPVLSLLKLWGVVPEEILPGRVGCKTETLVELLRHAGEKNPKELFLFLWADTVNSEWRARGSKNKWS